MEAAEQQDTGKNKTERNIKMAIKEYSRARDGEKKLSPSFRVREFACNDGSDPVMIDEELVVVNHALMMYSPLLPETESGKTE